MSTLHLIIIILAPPMAIIIFHNMEMSVIGTQFQSSHYILIWFKLLKLVG